MLKTDEDAPTKIPSPCNCGGTLNPNLRASDITWPNISAIGRTRMEGESPRVEAPSFAAYLNTKYIKPRKEKMYNASKTP